MIHKVTTLTEFILKEERKFRGAAGHFTLLLTHIQDAAKIIAMHIKKSGLVDILGATGEKNVYQEEVQKLDAFSNDVLVNILADTGHVHAILTEELDRPKLVRSHHGEYMVYMDPLDGSSNIEVGITVGTIFSIHRKPKSQTGEQALLQRGRDQVAAGYILYGTSVMFVYTCGDGVNGFTLDPAIGSFLLSHPKIKIPKKGSIYTMNESYKNRYHDYQNRYLDYIKEEDKKTGRPYSMRYAACMVADVHRILMHGGIFVYPENKKKPDGKLRLMYEVNPMSYVVAQSGGMARSLDRDPLTIQPTALDQRVPIALGSPDNVKEYLRFYKER